MSNKKCIICGREDQPWFSNKRCKKCASIDYHKKASEKPKKIYSIPKTTDKNKARRKEQRAGYGDFFEKHVSKIINEGLHCQECGAKLQGLTGEVAHILGKAKSPEVATNDDNVLYLCFWNGCHANFDSSLEKRQDMRVFPIALKNYNTLKSKLKTFTEETEHFESFLNN